MPNKNIVFDKQNLVSIRARKDGNVYSVDPKSSRTAFIAFSVKTKPSLDSVSIEVNPTCPDGNAELAAQAMKVLLDHYPGYTWIVEIDDRPNVGTMNIYNQEVNAAIFGGASYGYRIFLSTAQNDPRLLCVMRAGGEILERARLRRGWSQGILPDHIDGVKPQHQPLSGRN